MPRISKKQAFAKRDDEQSIPIDMDVHDFKFTKRWFRQRNQVTWSTFLPKKFSSDEPIKMIQIGVFEGMDLIWCLQNFLEHPDSRVFAVDPWAATRKLDQDHMDGVHSRAIHNLAPWRDQLEIVRGYSSDTLTQLVRKGAAVKDVPFTKNSIDLIVIDGDHEDTAVLEDALLSFELLKVGGWMVFDDVRNRGRKKHHVVDGLEMFLEKHEPAVELQWQHRFCDCYEKVGNDILY